MVSDIDLSWAENLRNKLATQGLKTTITAILLKAISVAQTEHPETRTARLPWGQIIRFNEIAAGFTVEKFVGTQSVVFFGLIKNSDTKSLEEISKELNDYAIKEISEIPQLALEDCFNRMPWIIRQFIIRLGLIFPGVRLHYMGATFGLSSLGKFGITGLIPPCVSTITFGIGAVEERPVARNGQIEIHPMMTMVLNFDHRLIDGAPAARFMQDVKALLEGGLHKYLEKELSSMISSEQRNLEYTAAGVASEML
jgi:pyruvate/2-oxoglutarate dehydrogenase complex dihydrolipoamide acyltransferase (E2) component